MQIKRTRRSETSARSRKTQPSYLFMMHCLAYSKVSTGLLSSRDPYDEDINVYLAQLLNSFINLEYVNRLKNSLSRYDIEAFQRLAVSTDARLKYTIYKTNSDFLLVSVAIFDNPSVATTKAKPRTQPSEEASVGRGKAYYHFAYTYSQQVHKRNPAISDVLEKLSAGFERYARILSHMRGEYVDILEKLSKGEVYHLERIVNLESRKELIKQKQDLLLDVYSEWKKTRADHLQKRLDQLVGEIRALDPSFEFIIGKKESPTS